MSHFNIKRIFTLCAAVVAAFAAQACLMSGDGGSSDGGGINGRWQLEREINVLVLGEGISLRDTTEVSTEPLDRTYLVINGTTFGLVTYDFGTGNPDTLVLPASLVKGQKWVVDGDTATIVRSGNTLRVTVAGDESEGELDSVIREYSLFTAAFPPAAWGTDTTGGGGSDVQTWKMVRQITIATDSTGTYTDTVDISELPVDIQPFFRIYDDSIVFVQSIASFMLSDTRIDATHWLNMVGDTLTLSFTGNNLTITNVNRQPEFGVTYVTRFEFVRYTGVFPPVEWRIALPATSTRLVVGAAEVTHSLAAGDTNWYSFAAEAGKTYHLHTSYAQDSLDTYLSLYNAVGDPLGWNDDEDPEAADFNGGLVWTAPSAGTYYFFVRGFDDYEVGDYKVSVERVNAVAKRASVDPLRMFRKVKPPKP